jgi:hypothetical protein
MLSVRSTQHQYMTIRDTVELWKAIERDYIGELQKSYVWVERDLYEVKLKDHSSVKAYVTCIQELIDQYAAGAKVATDRISKADHVFFLLNRIPQSDEWDVELRLIWRGRGSSGCVCRYKHIYRPLTSVYSYPKNLVLILLVRKHQLPKQRSTFTQAFVYIDTYSGQPRWPNDASLRIEHVEAVEAFALWMAMQISLD